MYKDKDKQREANRKAQAKFKAKGITEQGITGCIGTVPVIPIVIDVKPKRGKDIKCFIDLPMDVQQTITKLCPDVVKDHAERCRRSAIAIDYQHKHPDRYEPRSLPSCCVMTESEREGYKPASELKPGEYNHISKLGDADYNGVCT